MGDLMGHHARQFGLVISGQDQPGVDVEESSGKGHGVDFVGVHDLDGEGDFGVRVANQVLANTVDVLVDYRVLDHLQVPLNLLRVGPSDLDVGFDRVQVKAAYLAVADGIYILLAAIVLGFSGLRLVRLGGRLRLILIRGRLSLGLVFARRRLRLIRRLLLFFILD